MTKEEIKTVLLLFPQALQDNFQVLASLEINKSKKGITYTTNDLDAGELRHCYPTMPAQGKEILARFSKSGLATLTSNIKQRYAIKRAGLDYEEYFQQSMLRELHTAFERLKPFASLTKWYHKLKTGKDEKSGKDSFKTAPCAFSAFRPQLQFEVMRDAAGLSLHTQVVLNGTTFPLTDFNRYHFLLESRNEYYLLLFRDYQTLDWLQQNDPAQYRHDPQLLAHEVLSRLEEDYTVNRNQLFPQQAVETLPVNRVLLSELNNAFLMLTPQWSYDGFLMEGNFTPEVSITKNGETYLVHRNKEAEQQFTHLLEGMHANFRKQLNGYFYLSFEEAQKKQWFLKVYHQLLEQNIEVIGMDMLQHFRYSSHKIATEINIIKEEEHVLIMHMSVSFGEEAIPLEELQKILLASQRTVMLKDGALGVLSDEWLQEYGTILKHGKIKKKEIHVSKWLAFSDENKPGQQSALPPVIKEDWRVLWKRWQQEPDILFPVPAAVNATLRPYQQKGYEWMQLMAEAGAGACLADDMGLGKTLQTICFLAYRSELDPQSQHLIVCPSSLIYNWQSELQKFAPGIRTLVYHGADRRLKDITEGSYQVIITSYGTTRSDIEELCQLRFGAVVLDESHHIKNPAAQITKAVARIPAITRVALSGTPVMNNTFDLYAQLDFLLPGIFGSREFFKREYADAIDRDQDQAKLNTLQKLTAPFILRRTKSQVARDLPEKTEMVLWCEMGTAQKALYDQIRDSIRSSLFLNIQNEGLSKSKLAVLQGMLKLRQLCNSPLLLPQEEQHCEDSVKSELLLEELTTNLKDHKVLVFSQFTSMLDLLAAACRERNIAHYHFDGQTPPAQRAAMVENFQQEGNKVNVFLISLKAGNAGLNLTAADYVFLFDPWWNTAVQQQAIDRTHRIGQTKNIFAYKMICKDTIEEKIIQLQQRKKQLAEVLVTADEGFVKALTEDDIQFLFS